MNDAEQIFLGVLGFAIAVTAVIFLFTFAVFLLPIAGIGAVIFGGVYYHYHSPSFLENKAREHTHVFYEEAKTRYNAKDPHDLAAEVIEELPETPLAEAIGFVALEIIKGASLAAIPEPPLICHSIEGARYRDKLAAITEFPSTDRAKEILVEAFTNFLRTLPDISDDALFGVRLVDRMGNPGESIEALAVPLYREKGLFVELKRTLDINFREVSGPKHDVMPSEYKGENIAYAYLKDTPLLALFDLYVPFGFSQATRFEHHWIVAGTGHGKTQTIQYLVSHDLKKVAAGRASVVIIDSQGDLIKNISRLRLFAPGQPLHGKLCLIDPTDIEYPVALNLFSLGTERLDTYSELERAKLQNTAIELYEYILGALLGAEMTSKQSTLFRYVLRLMLHIEGATIHTFREIMSDGIGKYAEAVKRLPQTAQTFFAEEFDDREFSQTRSQVNRRLWAILENQTFERMFSHPKSKLDLFDEMNAGKVILINTAKELLKQGGTEVFGRFFIALIAQAAQERATLRHTERLPTFVYIDEVQDYVDQNVSLILEQARKQNVGVVLSHQYVGQLAPKLQESFAANTSIKFAGGVSSQDARVFARHLRCDPSFIEEQPKGFFAAFVKGQTDAAVSLRVEFGVLEDMPRMTDEEQRVVRDDMRQTYAVHFSELQHSISASSAVAVDPDAVSTDAATKW